MKQNIPLILYLTVLLVSCKDSKEEKVADLLHQWNGKEIYFPQKMDLISYIDTNKTVAFESWKAKYTIVLTHLMDLIIVL